MDHIASSNIRLIKDRGSLKRKGRDFFACAGLKNVQVFFSIIKTSLEQMGNNIKEELRVRS